MFVCLLCFFICLFALTVQSICRFFSSPSHSIWSYNPFSCTWIMFCLFVIVSLLIANYEDSKFVGEKKQAFTWFQIEWTLEHFFLSSSRSSRFFVNIVCAVHIFSFFRQVQRWVWVCVCVCSCRHIYICGMCIHF